MHLAELLFDEEFHAGGSRKLDLGQFGRATRLGADEPEPAGRSGWETDRHRPARHRADTDSHVRAVEAELADDAELAGRGFGQQFNGHRRSGLARRESQASGGEGLLTGQVDHTARSGYGGDGVDVAVEEVGQFANGRGAGGFHL